MLEGRDYGVLKKCTYTTRTQSRRGSNFAWFGSLTASVGPALPITHRLRLSPVEVTGYSHTAKCPLTIRPSRAALAGPIGCFASDKDQFCVRSTDDL